MTGRHPVRKAYGCSEEPLDLSRKPRTRLENNWHRGKLKITLLKIGSLPEQHVPCFVFVSARQWEWLTTCFPDGATSGRVQNGAPTCCQFKLPAAPTGVLEHSLGVTSWLRLLPFPPPHRNWSSSLPAVSQPTLNTQWKASHAQPIGCTLA